MAMPHRLSARRGRLMTQQRQIHLAFLSVSCCQTSLASTVLRRPHVSHWVIGDRDSPGRIWNGCNFTMAMVSGGGVEEEFFCSIQGNLGEKKVKYELTYECVKRWCLGKGATFKGLSCVCFLRKQRFGPAWIEPQIISGSANNFCQGRMCLLETPSNSYPLSKIVSTFRYGSLRVRFSC